MVLITLPYQPKIGDMTEKTGHRKATPEKTASGKSPRDKTARPATGRWRETVPARKARMRSEYALLVRLYPLSRTTLDYSSAWQLLVSTVLSAQTSDARVNMVTPRLFARYPTPADLGRADQEDVESIIRSIGFFRTKAAHIIALSRAIDTDFGGRVPENMTDLTSLPGVGRKTANVVLGDYFHKPGFPVDTHVRRVTSRLRWHDEWNKKNPDVVRIEKEVTPVFDPSQWADLSHRLIYLGREICHAQRPECEVCPLNATCPAGVAIMKKRGTRPVASGEEAIDMLHAQGRGIPLTTAKR